MTGETASMMFQGTKRLLGYCKTIVVGATIYQVSVGCHTIYLISLYPHHDSMHLNYYFHFTDKATKGRRRLPMTKHLEMKKLKFKTKSDLPTNVPPSIHFHLTYKSKIKLSKNKGMTNSGLMTSKATNQNFLTSVYNNKLSITHSALTTLQ